MSKIFFYNLLDNEKILYEDLLNRLNKKNTFYYPYCYTKKYSDIFIDILVSLLADDEIVLLDSDFSKEELGNISVNKEKLSIRKKVEYSPLKSLQDLIFRIKNASKWRVTLFSSGTTGLPKKITHNYFSITKEVKISKEKINNTWGFAYNPTHIAGLQVFFQALLNYNSIINLFQLSRKDIFKLIKKYKITNISATPTFYRQLLPPEDIFPSVERITFGGEKYDKKLSKELKKIFTQAKILNIYALTETGTIFASKGDNFALKDKYKDLIKIVNNELLIHKDLLGEFDLLELKKSSWYHTNDIVEIIKKNPLEFKFKYRKSEMINVGGYKVSPYEVEEVIRKHPKVQNVVVYGKSNSVMGNLIYCDIELKDKKIKEKDIRLFLLDKLQNFKIPRIINFVDNISTARTGKVKRV